MSSAKAAAVITATALALGGCASNATTGTSATDGAIQGATNEILYVDSRELAGNLLGVSSEITVGVLLPAAYDAHNHPLPVVYFLPGYTADNVAADMPHILGAELDATQPMIIVTITGVNELGGGWYTDSPATGNWEQAIVAEIVPMIDARYRTIPEPAGRGLTGHSMGGYGALAIGMNHPDVFGSVFIMSPAIAGADGVGRADVFGSPVAQRSAITSIEALEGLVGDELLVTMADSAAMWEFSYGTAFAPSTEPPYFRYPFTFVDGEIVRDDAVWAQWEAGFGGLDTEVASHRDALLGMSAVGVDCGSNDEYQWIFDGCEYLDQQLTA